MMYERIKELCKLRGISVNSLEKEVGTAKGYMSKIDTLKPSNDRICAIAKALGVTPEYLTNGKEADSYYLNEETTRMAQSIFENKELRLLFDAAQDAAPEDLQTVHSMLLALKRKERGNID